jgi:CRP/FNR family transcriptional regulator
MDRVKILKQTEIFKGLDTGALQEISRSTQVIKLGRKQILFLAGEESKGLYIIAEGSIRAYKTSASGREQTIHVEKAISTIGEVPLIDDGKHPSTATAEENSTLLLLEKNLFVKFALQYPEILLALAKVFAKRLRHCAMLVEIISLEEVNKRLAHFLCDEVKQKYKLLNGEVRLKLTLTHNEIATRIGSVREVVTRAFHNLEDRKLIEFKDKELIIPDFKKLKSFAKHVE